MSALFVSTLLMNILVTNDTSELLNLNVPLPNDVSSVDVLNVYINPAALP